MKGQMRKNNTNPSRAMKKETIDEAMDSKAKGF